MRIIIKNLPKDITKEKITKEFSSYGEITDVEFPKENRQFCFVGYRNSESADKAVKDMNKSYIKNYRINVELVKKDEYEEKTKRLKKLLNKEEEEKYLNTLKLKVTNLPECTEKELKAIYKPKECHIDEGFAIVLFDNIEDSKKAQKIDIVLGKRVRYDKYVDEKDDTHYNSLFFDFTTIIEKMCGQQKIKKEELLNLEDKDLGSKIAILESHLVEQTKKWLEENDIDITTNYKKVNKRVLLIRNFDVINQLEINGKIKISPSKTMAIVKFDTEEEAKKAYNKYMLKRVNDKAIYCEFLKTGDKEEIKVKTSNKLVIKNIPFQANENDIAKIIESQVKIVSLRLPKKRDGTIRGFCFVELGSEEEAKLVIKKFGTSTHLYGRRLVFQYADQ